MQQGEMLRTVPTGHSNDESTVGISAGYLFIIRGKSPILRVGESVDDLKVLNPTRGNPWGAWGFVGKSGMFEFEIRIWNNK